MERTDNDTWGLATSVGQRELDWAEVDTSDTSWSMRLMNDLMVARTRYIDGFFAHALSAGVRQAVILASGLDARGYRMSWPEGMRLFEIDQPQVLEFKAATLAALGAEPTTQLRAVPIDLRQDWPAALCAAGFDPQQSTAWSAEGLLAFLSPEAQDRLLDDITALSAKGSRLVAEIFFLDDSEQVTQAALRRWYDHGLDVRLDHLGYLGERNDAAAYLDARAGLRHVLRWIDCWPRTDYRRHARTANISASRLADCRPLHGEGRPPLDKVTPTTIKIPTSRFYCVHGNRWWLGCHAIGEQARNT